MSALISSPGFADPVADAQATFRAVLDAMARPGHVHRAGENLQPPSPLDRATAAVLLTLADNDTPLWLDPAAAAASDWLAFHCGTSIVSDPAYASFVVTLSLPDLAVLPAGSHEAPESSATLILQVRALGNGTRWRLAGPGLREPTLLAIDGLPRDFARIWRDNHALFPRGVDIVLCAGDQLSALPRSVTVEEA
jgi:alpha-D-ribose 1-methylphosphonate 5-triphosphate synthase subunit PhnH